MFQEPPPHLARMVLFKVNTGTREQEVCHLRWDWEIEVPELGTNVFLIPANFGGRTEHSGVKNGEDRLVVLNDVARSVVESCRGKYPERVFTLASQLAASTTRHGARRASGLLWSFIRTLARAFHLSY